MAEKRKFAALAELHRQPVEAETPGDPRSDPRRRRRAAGGEGQGPSADRQAQQSRMEALFALPEKEDAARGSRPATGRG